MSSPGWFPDPGGQPGMYRYWTGSAWTPYLNNTPFGPAPSLTAAVQSDSQQPATPPKSPIGWIIALVAVLATVGVLIWFLMQPGSPIRVPNPNPVPTGEHTSAVDMCPKATDENPPGQEVINGRIYGGKLSYQQLGGEWSAPKMDDRLAFADHFWEQTVLDQPNYNNDGHSWVASVLIAEVYTGEGFGSTKIGAETILQCAMGIFYDNTAVTQEIHSSASHPVDGYDGWLIETDVHFDIPNLNATYDSVLFLMVRTADNRYSVFYSSVPNTISHLNADARTALESLRVDG